MDVVLVFTLLSPRVLLLVGSYYSFGFCLLGLGF